MTTDVSTAKFGTRGVQAGGADPNAEITKWGTPVQSLIHRLVNQVEGQADPPPTSAPAASPTASPTCGTMSSALRVRLAG